MKSPDSRQTEIRPATSADGAAITAIYAHHVLHGLGSFEETAPDLTEMTARIAGVLDAGLPWLVAEIDGQVQGYACARPYNLRSGYRFCVEDSVFIASEAQGRGLGRSLLGGVVGACTALGRTQMLALIGDSGNLASIGLHETLGFRRTGLLREVGFKAGRWLDVVVMQRALCERAD